MDRRSYSERDNRMNYIGINIEKRYGHIFSIPDDIDLDIVKRILYNYFNRTRDKLEIIKKSEIKSYSKRVEKIYKWIIISDFVYSIFENKTRTIKYDIDMFNLVNEKFIESMIKYWKEDANRNKMNEFKYLEKNYKEICREAIIRSIVE